MPPHLALVVAGLRGGAQEDLRRAAGGRQHAAAGAVRQEVAHLELRTQCSQRPGDACKSTDARPKAPHSKGGQAKLAPF